MVIEVAVAAPLRDPLSYLVPAADADLVRRGSVVLAPLHGRLVPGYVLGVGGDGPEGIELKPVREVLEAGEAVPADLLALAEAAADYYLAPLGEVLRSALPLTRTVSRRSMRLTERGRSALAGGDGSVLAPADREALRALEAEAQDVGAKGLSARVRRLIDEGYAEVEADAKRTHAREVTSVRLGLVPGVSPEERRRLAGRSVKAVQLVDRLGAVGEGASEPLDDLRAELGPGVAAIAKRLEERGVVRSERVARARDLERAAGRDRLEPPTRRYSALALTPPQEAAAGEVGAALARGGFAPFLLHGVTGSGKTLVYLAAIDAALARGRSAILLVPEIALTPVLHRELRGRYGDEVAVLHSGVPPGERHDAWRRVRAGAARVVFGARSAVLAPAVRLGLIVVDEEHDPSYKQGERPHYHARDLAVLRAKQLGIPVLLGSATPSLESYGNARAGRYRLLALGERAAGQELPAVEVVDLRDEFERTGAQMVLSDRLREEMRLRLEHGEQTVLLLNRRGYANFLLCRECGARTECPNCSVCLSFHLRGERLKCHHCDYERRAPKACAACQGSFLQLVGHGTEKVESLVRDAFPAARVARLDRDAVRRRDDLATVLGRFERGEVDILVGTQMVAKGHDFPRVTLVGVVSVDAMLALPDFRATERAFALLTQVAGRAGRGERPGLVILQTYHPDNDAVRLACEQDYARFYEREARLRRLMRYPPSTHLVNLIARGPDAERVQALGGDVARALGAPRSGPVSVLGPALAPIQRLKREWRSQVLVKAATRPLLRAAMEAAWPGLRPLVERGALDVDVDPQDLL